MHMKMLLLSYENGLLIALEESQRCPLMLWLTSGLGCSALSALTFEIDFKYNFVDLPANTGFSYAKPPIATQRSDSKQVQHAVQFIRKGYILGNPITNFTEDQNYKIPFAHGMELISDELYQSYGELLITYWVNDVVRRALGIRQGSIGQWKRCLKTPYAKDIESSFPFHVELSTKEYRALVYSGDHDFVVPFSATQAWIRSLNYSIVDEWRPWLVQTQIAGYTRMYLNGMTFATVKEDPKGEVHIVVVNSLVLVSVIELHHEGYGVVEGDFKDSLREGTEQGIQLQSTKAKNALQCLKGISQKPL
ncbi:serine carboxypeptidase-like 7 isoform X4 [Senna tora]|uniref:Serine carboxypeptidase-like 7 isoform X4 n=1 Tax=Senna tora TaxID=362788 RepID=A0A834SZ48_9FABA|nr:serine carboxypeptidase-like 7 isoform X4 [Senna tora]